MFVLSELGLARAGLVSQAADTARRVVELGHARGDDQAVLPCLSTSAWTLARAGDAAEAVSLLEDLLTRRRANPGGLMPGYWLTFASLALERLGRSGALASLDESHGSRFLEAALQIDSGRFEDAAETLRAVGTPQPEAEGRILAARERRISGDDAGADALLARARALLIGLAATARLRDLDAEVGVSSRSGER